MLYRIFVEKKDGFEVEARDLFHDFQENLQISSLKKVRELNIYDISGLDSDQLDTAVDNVFSEKPTDTVYKILPDFPKDKIIAVEYLPGQYDQRADSAVQCLKLVLPQWDGEVKSGKLLVLEGELSANEIETIKKYYINPVESREKDLDDLHFDAFEQSHQTIPSYTGLINFSKEELASFRIKLGLAMSDEDMGYIQQYFRDEEKRDPTETEIKVLDTYWSDHCRHTTFETEITDIEFPEDQSLTPYNDVYKLYQDYRKETGRENKPQTLMDLATIYPRLKVKRGEAADLDISEEINACSVKVEIDVDGKKEPWLLMFKNETHNHPTEIEPFGGASTCIGGAIRDPLSGRAFVHQAMRITGSGDPREKITETLPGKLPQEKITKTAAHGYSSYGNQIGLATSFVREFYHEGYKAKRMEVGAVVAAVKESYVRRERPEKGDVVILIGGKTGRDGCGGATGSSKEHTEESLQTCGAEVQKGNAPEERKIQRLFRNPEVTRLVKRCNDFGAGGVSVAIGELCDGLNIDLDKVSLKYLGLTGTEIAISESQERMAVVVESCDSEKLIKLADSENLEAVQVAEVTDLNRLVMTWQGQTIVDINRDFLNTNGARATTRVKLPEIEKRNPLERSVPGSDIKEKFLNNIQDLNVCSQRGLTEMFDSSIGRGTVHLPYGGNRRLSENESSIHKFPVPDMKTNSASVISCGYNPFISEWSPFHGAVYAVTESVTRAAASGAKWENIRFSFQEYFRRMGNDSSNWGLPFASLSGALYAQDAFGMPAIGGKDSMSGTFHDIHVPPTLISFAVTTAEADKVISSDLKKSGSLLYCLKHTFKENFLPDIDQLIKNFTAYSVLVDQGKVLSAASVHEGGFSEVLTRMSLGNGIGIKINSDFIQENLFSRVYGNILFESDLELEKGPWILVGETDDSNQINVNGNSMSLNEVEESFTKPLSSVFSDQKSDNSTSLPINEYKGGCLVKYKSSIAKPRVTMPVFPGNNCEYDSAAAFHNAGAETDIQLFRNRTKQQIEDSLNSLAKSISTSQILMIVGGFSAGDEPDGSGKFIANVLRNEQIRNAIHNLLDRDGLVLGICNGFQALVKSGLLPGGRISVQEENSPTLTFNTVNRHVARMVTTRTASNLSPWLSNMEPGTSHTVAVSHGEGRFYADETRLDELFSNGQVAFQYTGPDGLPTMNPAYNPNGSLRAIEGITSRDGRILGKMGHSERYDKGCFRNINGNKNQDIFTNGVKYFL